MRRYLRGTRVRERARKGVRRGVERRGGWMSKERKLKRTKVTTRMRVAGATTMAATMAAARARAGVVVVGVGVAVAVVAATKLLNDRPINNHSTMPAGLAGCCFLPQARGWTETKGA